MSEFKFKTIYYISLYIYTIWSIRICICCNIFLLPLLYTYIFVLFFIFVFLIFCFFYILFYLSKFDNKAKQPTTKQLSPSHLFICVICVVFYYITSYVTFRNNTHTKNRYVVRC